MRGGPINMFITYIFFGIAPSIIWLLFYLRKDSNPESNRMIVKVFLYGMIAVIPAYFVEMALGFAPKLFSISPFWVYVINAVIITAVVEEIFKYWTVKKTALKNSEFDEPIDAMLYMIIAALGFAALENLLYLWPASGDPAPLDTLVNTSALRFLLPVFLHALASGILGFFLALSFFYTKKRAKLKILGIGIAIVLHGLFNFFIIQLDQDINAQTILHSKYFYFLIAIMLGSAIFVSWGFKRLKKFKSVCRIII